jgi:HSP20 family protein
MYLRPWDAFESFGGGAADGFTRRMQRLFGDMETLLNAVGVPAALPAARPALNLWEESGAYVLESELPGVAAEDVDLDVRADELTVKVRSRAAEAPKDAVWHRRERSVGEFVRTLRLPSLVDADQVTAEFRNGVLRVRMPKPAAAQPRKIAIRAEPAPQPPSLTK